MPGLADQPRGPEHGDRQGLAEEVLRYINSEEQRRSEAQTLQRGRLSWLSSRPERPGKALGHGAPPEPREQRKRRFQKRDPVGEATRGRTGCEEAQSTMWSTGKDSYLLKCFWVPTPEGFLGPYSRRVLGSLLPKIKKKETKRNLGREYEPLQATCELRQHTPAKKRRVGKSHGAALFGPPSEKS